MKNLTKFPTTWFRQGLIIALAALLSLLYRNAFAQSSEKIDLTLQEATFEEAVEELIKKTDVNIIYNNEEIKDLPKITLQLKQVTVEQALDELLKDSNLSYQKINDTIVVGPTKDDPNPPSAPGFKQTLRGTIYDKDSQAPLSFATVQVMTTETVKGAITDIDGNFSIPNLPIGRHSIKVSFVGYEDAYVNDILLGTGKETIITVSLSEQLTNLSEVVVTASNGEPINEMATVSAKSFDAEETKRYAASISDPARMALSFAGVATTDDASNEIVIRGNSPNWMLWKLEGVEIPSPNHFAEEGYSSGAISILSSNMLGNSDFYTGAFSADYGNALSGIFDLKLRNGNNQEYEHTFQAGVLGVDFASEGPFKKGYSGSYLFNYRYSTLGLLNALNFEVSENALPSYQDLSFKFNLPTENLGTFSIWGIGGLSKAVEHFEPDSIEVDDWEYGYHDDTYTGMFAYGLTHNYFIDNNSFVETVISHSKSFSDENYETMDSTWTLSPVFQDDLNKGAIRLSSYYNRKINSRLTMRTGAIISRLNYHYESREWMSKDNEWNVEIDTEGNTYLYQGYVMGKYKFSDKVVATGGVHYTRFELNKDQVLEPRLSLAVGMKNQQKLTFGYGRHSRHESLPLYFVRTYADNGQIYMPNRMLELTRASHYVLGYEKAFSKSLNFKIEGYYQQVNNLPVPNNPDSYYTPIFGGYSDLDTLVNKGKARNIGIELTLQRFFANNYYFLVTSSIFDSKYQPLDGKWYNSRYNLNYVNNFVFGKEFEWGDNKRVGLNTKVMWTGGKRQYPIDLERSKAEDETYVFEDQPWSHQTPDYFRLDAGVKVHFFKKGKEQVISLDIQNVTNRLNTWAQFYNPQTDKVEDFPMAGLIPILNYRLEF
ncbi:MAG: TonB-dependent receptor [Rickettsiales bacterium]|nr:TonB-dependent receptor [Rickettsiales bacterium]